MRHSVLFLLLAFSLLTACESDTESASLEGEWQVLTARRNGAETPMMDGTPFRFGEDGSFFTGLLGNEATGTFAREGDVITTAGLEPALEYEVRALTDTTLNLRADYRGFQFDFDLVRKPLMDQ